MLYVNPFSDIVQNVVVIRNILWDICKLPPAKHGCKPALILNWNIWYLDQVQPTLHIIGFYLNKTCLCLHCLPYLSLKRTCAIQNDLQLHTSAELNGIISNGICTFALLKKQLSRISVVAVKIRDPHISSNRLKSLTLSIHVGGNNTAICGLYCCHIQCNYMLYWWKYSRENILSITFVIPYVYLSSSINVHQRKDIHNY